MLVELHYCICGLLAIGDGGRGGTWHLLHHVLQVQLVLSHDEAQILGAFALQQLNQ